MIGVFDSGLGGLTVVKQIFKYLPKYQIVYFGDTARLPYGNKSKETIQRYSLENTRFLIRSGAKVIIVACNTSSALALNYLKQRFKKFPIFGVVQPAVEKALKVGGAIGIIGTHGTVGSRVFPKLIINSEAKTKVYQQACPLFVPLVEEGWTNHSISRKIIKEYLKPLKIKEINTLILACTHYPYLKKQIRNLMGSKVSLVDPGQEVAVKLKDFLEKHSRIEKRLSKGKSHQFFASDITLNLNQMAQRWLGRKIKFKKHV